MGSRHEDRKVKSRIAAQGRRNCENKEFKRLADCLPLDPNISHSLDKASIIRICISFLRLQQQLGINLNDDCYDEFSYIPTIFRSIEPRISLCRPHDSVVEANSVLDANQSFLVFINQHGRILYASRSTSSVIGVQQSDIIGHYVCSFIHEDDRTPVDHLLRTMLTDFDPQQLSGRHVQFVAKMKCSLEKRFAGTSKVTSVHKPMVFAGISIPPRTDHSSQFNVLGMHQVAFAAIVSPFQFQHGSLNLFNNQMLIQLDLSLRIIGIPKYGIPVIPLAKDLTLYSIVHPMDLQLLLDAHRDLFQKGYCYISSFTITCCDQEIVCRLSGHFRPKSNSEEKTILMTIEQICNYTCSTEDKNFEAVAKIEAQQEFPIEIDCFQKSQPSSYPLVDNMDIDLNPVFQEPEAMYDYSFYTAAYSSNLHVNSDQSFFEGQLNEYLNQSSEDYPGDSFMQIEEDNAVYIHPYGYYGNY